MIDKIENGPLLAKIATAQDAAALIRPGMTVAMGGYSMSGYPKVVAMELARRRSLGEDMTVSLVTGANVGQLDDLLGDVIARRAPMCASRELAARINSGVASYVEQQMNRMPQLLRREAFGHIDVAVVEALGLTGEGFLIPTSSIGFVPHLINLADRIIVEINTAQPPELRAFHDVHVPAAPPRRAPIPLTGVAQRIGEPHIRLDPSKIAAIVASDIPDAVGAAARSSQATDRVADHLFAFLDSEIHQGFGGELPPFQTGFGSMAVSLARAMARSALSDIRFFCGGVGEPILELVLEGKVSAVSTGGVEMSPGATEMIRSRPELRERLVIRNGDVTNSSEVISRLGLIALNTGIEVDIFGNVNSSHIGGTRVVNGIGGGANFAQNAGLSVILLPSTGKDGAISTVVPMVSHQDICEHDVDIVVTEHGLADLRGRGEVERARAVIGSCADPSYRDQLMSYLARAERLGGGHHPQLPDEAFAWHRRLRETGSMRE
jgi:succinyl-CoA:acetate CoA-transferase